MGAAVVFKTNMKNFYRDQLTESLGTTNSLLENLTNSCQKNSVKNRLQKQIANQHRIKTTNQQEKKITI
jgi:hypothetical protein